MFVRRSVRVRVALWLGACLSVASCASKPPEPTGSVNGIAVDTFGHSLPGVTVTIQSGDGKAVETVQTAADGSYSFPTIPVGQYRVLTLFAGFTAPDPLIAIVTAGQSTRLKPLVLVPPDVAMPPAAQ